MISIIVPVYNTGQKLETMLNSIRNQSYMDWELILVDDGSSDDTPEICYRASREDFRITCIHQENSGVSAARNRGMSEAKGDYIAFLDGDDLIDTNYLEELQIACKDADIAVCDVIVEKDGKETQRFTLKGSMLTQQQGLDYLLSRRGINSGPCAKLFRKSIVEALQFPALHCYEDILFVRDAFCQAERIAVTDRTSYHYIDNAEGTMSGIRNRGLHDVVSATEELLSFLEIRRDLNPECYYVTASHLMQYVLEAVLHPTNIGNELINDTKKLFREHIRGILRCKAFPNKEKIMYFLFSMGWLYRNKKFWKC